MSRNVANSAKAERDKLRERMRSYRCTTAQIAAEMGRRFNLRPRVAWRYALGWPQWKVAQQYNTLHAESRLSHGRVSDLDKWPHGDSPPSPRYLAKLAATFGHGCTPAQLVEAGLPDATSGTTLLRLTSQQARISAARNRPGEVSRALALAETAPTERTADEPGVLGFDAGIVALYASEAHYVLGGTDHLDTAVRWAQTALDEFTAQPRPRIQDFASARFDLATLARGDLEAVGEHLAPILRATTAEYRTVPIIGRARSLHTLLGQRPNLASPTLTTLRDDIAEFVTHPAPTPPALEPGTPT